MARQNRRKITLRPGNSSRDRVDDRDLRVPMSPALTSDGDLEWRSEDGGEHGWARLMRPGLSRIQTPHVLWLSSDSLLILAVVCPGGVLVVEGAGLGAAVRDAGEPVGELARRGVVALAAAA